MNQEAGYALAKQGNSMQALFASANLKANTLTLPIVIVWPDKILVMMRNCPVVTEEVGSHLEIYSAQTPCTGPRVEYVGFQIKHTRKLCEQKTLVAGRAGVRLALAALSEDSQVARSYGDLLRSLLDEVEDHSFTYLQP